VKHVETDSHQQYSPPFRSSILKALNVAVLVLALLVAGQPVGQMPGAPPAPSDSGARQSSNRAPVSAPPQSSFSGSVPAGNASSEIIPLTFRDALDRGLRQNLGLLLASDNTIAARGQKWRDLSELLPKVNFSAAESVQETSLAALGFRLPGLPRVIGPFGFFDGRLFLNQSLFNLTDIQHERAATLNVKAAQYNYKDARELVVLAVGNSYLQALAGEARVETADAQVKTAQALYGKAVDQQKAGVTAAIDALRAQVEYQARQQQLIVAQNNFAKQKLGLARIIGLPPGQDFTLVDKAPYEPVTTLGLEQSLERAYAARPDYQALLAETKASELSRRAAAAEHLPALAVAADYGDIGVNPSNSNGTYHVTGTINIPIFQGGKAHADALEAEATLRQNRAQLENLRAQIDYEVRTAMLDLNAAADQVAVARSSVDLAGQTLTQAQDRFAAGVTDNLEVIQAQEALASAHENYIASLYAHNVAKVEFAKAIGSAEEGVKQYWKGK